MVTSASIQVLSGPRRDIARRTRGPLAAMACVAMLLCGCNSGGSGSGGGDHGGSSGGGGGNGGGGGGNGGGGGGGGGHRYGFSLPSGPTSGEPFGLTYNYIRAGQCDDAQQQLDSQIVDETSYSKILRIGIAVCRNHLDTAKDDLRTLSRPSFDRDSWYLCQLYRASASVVYQRPRSAFGTCPPPPVESPDPSGSEGSTGPSGPPDSAGPSDSPEASTGTGG
ncbi:hypothetical protein NE236_26890 [Actinoallomurus purpureus]|uniref:hypothetical protein n=1 Tax=Actinoallomurus purpureus TaxID=478114 RepID=UPI0020938125|nr:hypothetical protein [Actinoallomurus purpureus]MCO6008605.1 hypothetical protein [Actinoallomurus purpureus]